MHSVAGAPVSVHSPSKHNINHHVLKITVHFKYDRHVMFMNFTGGESY